MNTASKVAAVVGLVFVGYMALNPQTPNQEQKPSLDSSQCKPTPTPTQVSKDERQMTLDEKLEILRKLKERLNEKEQSLINETTSEGAVKTESNTIEDRLDEHKEAAADFLKNSPRITPEVLAVAIRDEDVDVRSYAAGNPACPPEALAVAIRDEDVGVRYWAAYNPACPPEVLAVAIRDEDVWVRRWAADNLACPPEALAVAIRDEDVWVRRYAAQNPACSPEVLAVAIRDEDADVRWASIKNPNASHANITQALQDENAEVREAAQEKASVNNSKAECSDTCDLKKKKEKNNEEL